MKENNISVKELSKEYLRIEKNKLARLLREQKRMIENQLEYYTELWDELDSELAKTIDKIHELEEVIKKCKKNMK